MVIYFTESVFCTRNPKGLKRNDEKVLQDERQYANKERERESKRKSVVLVMRFRARALRQRRRWHPALHSPEEVLESATR